MYVQYLDLKAFAMGLSGIHAESSGIHTLKSIHNGIQNMNTECIGAIPDTGIHRLPRDASPRASGSNC
jgi:hypothetical protein